MNPKIKKLWSDTPAQVSGATVLVVLLALLGLVIWSGTHNPRRALRFIIAATIGGVVAWRVLRTGTLYLDPQRTVTGKLAKVLGIVGAIVAVVAAFFAVAVVYRQYIS
jgi:hypothetical protein